MELLRGTQAHMSFEDAVASFPHESLNERPPNVPYTPWHLLEHLRITQWDILEYVRDAERHVSPPWPRGYWPARSATATREDLEQTVDGFLADRAALEAIVRNPDTDVFAVLPGTPGHTVFREVVVLGNHNSYHSGEFGILRQVMGTWRR